MTALVRYQLDLLVRSQRWLPPFLGYALLMAVGLASGGQPMMDSLGYGAGMLVPVTAWYVRCALTADPPPARAVLVAAAGAARVQLASLLAALLAGLALSAVGVAAVWLISGHTTNDPHRQVSSPAAALAGLLAAVACVLVGMAVGAVCSRPVVVRAPYGILATFGLSVAALVAGLSPANHAVRALVLGSQLARVGFPVAALLGAGVLAVLVAAGTAALAGRRTE